ncbi:MAG TPA: hypothetical protein PKH39_07380 [Woeseiaceae bacterium]|nr:hypothetical protein [Woeseiaceae bacterium]
MSSSVSMSLCWGGLIALVCFAYWPGLSGPFIFDDFGSITALGNRGGVVDWESFKAFVFGGHSGPTGRPIALLTFLIDATNWPADAWPFKRTNLVIHCLCGIFLGLLMHRILLLLRYERRNIQLLAIAATAIWLLHPYLVSTTLYVVQRMAQLSTLFILIGLYFYIRGRVLLPTTARKAYVMMSSSILLFSVLATLSKENGILLPLLAGVLEVTIIASQRDTLGRLNRSWSIIFLILPAAFVFVYLSGRVFRADFFDIVPPRDFSIYERALTQPRILFDYLQNWFVPKLYTTGVFQDHFPKSTGLFAPTTTVLSLLAHCGIVALALVKRQRWPLFAFGALFFYTSHLLESTVVNLELYFEHRNYLGTGFLFLSLLAALQRKVSAKQFVMACLAITGLLAGFTRYSSSVWSSWPSMVEVSAYKAPMSERLQAQYSVLLFRSERQSESIEVLNRAIERIPGPNALLRVNRLASLCQMNELSSSEFDDEANTLAQLPYDPRLIRAYTALANSVVNQECPAVSSEQLTSLFSRMLDVPFNAIDDSIQYSQVQYLVGFAHAYSGRPGDAVAAFNESLSAKPGASHAMLMAAVLASNQFGEEALEFSSIALANLDTARETGLVVAPVSESDIREFQRRVRADINAAKDADTAHEER